MSRSGYSEDCEGLNLWRGAVERAINGKRGQAFLREMLEALDALPRKALAEGSFTRGGEICALGSVAIKRGIDVSGLEPAEQDDYAEVDRDAVGNVFGIAPAMAAEIMFENDEGGWSETPEQRWDRVRRWVASQLQRNSDAQG